MKIIVKNVEELLKVSKILEERKYIKIFDGVYSKIYLTNNNIMIRVFVE